jgi:hypothetical protein
MEYQEIYDVVNNNKGRFKVIFNSGAVDIKRLFISESNDICEFHPRSRTRGRIIYTNDIINVIPIKNKTTKVDKCRRNLRNVVKYLSASGFWTPMLNCAKVFLTLSDEELVNLCEWEQYNNFLKIQQEQNNNISWFGYDCFINLFSKSIKTMNFDKYNRSYQMSVINSNIANRINCSHRWTNGYDNSYEIRFDEDFIRGWYSEEYRGCCNGHYYFLLDNCHAIFGEDD